MPSRRMACALGGAIARRAAPAGVVAGALALAVLAALGATVPVRAQEPGNGEVSIGTFNLGTSHDGFSVVEPPTGIPEPRRENPEDGSGRWFFQNWYAKPAPEASAESLYTSAMEALDAGRRDEAQGLLERLISEAPSSPRARAARQHLGQIYRGAEPEAQAVPAGRADVREAPLPWTQDTAERTAAATRPAVAGVSQPLSRAALHQARVSPAIDGQFLSDAGDRVFFGSGNAVLGTRARGVIQSQARFLIRFPNLFAAIEGHADDGTVSDAEALRLSEERAAVVRERLIAEGVPAHRVVAYGRGMDERVSDCPAPECMAQNRRAVTILLNHRVEAKPVRRAQGAGTPGAADPPPTP